MVATDMAQVHNIMIRGLNSMLIQAPFISSPIDTKDFVDYALSFCVLIHEHHNTEEVLVSPLIEDATGLPGIMDKIVVQHEAFIPKLHDFKNYLVQIKLGVRKYDAKKFVALLNSFAGLMVEHLTEEVLMLVEMEKYAIDWKPINERAVKLAVETVDKVRVCSAYFLDV
jgi:hemerythrin-like domain-containing protein